MLPRIPEEFSGIIPEYYKLSEENFNLCKNVLGEIVEDTTFFHKDISILIAEYSLPDYNFGLKTIVEVSGTGSQADRLLTLLS